MTSGQQAVQIEDMNALVKAFDWGKDSFTQSRTNIGTQVQQITSGWTGQAPTAFGQAMQTFDQKMQGIINDCQTIIQQLTSAGATYDTMIQTTSQAGSTLQQAMESGV